MAAAGGDNAKLHRACFWKTTNISVPTPSRSKILGIQARPCATVLRRTRIPLPTEAMFWSKSILDNPDEIDCAFRLLKVLKCTSRKLHLAAKILSDVRLNMLKCSGGVSIGNRLPIRRAGTPSDSGVDSASRPPGATWDVRAPRKAPGSIACSRTSQAVTTGKGAPGTINFSKTP